MQIVGRTGLVAPTRTADGNFITARQGPYGDVGIWEGMVAPDYQGISGFRQVARNAPGVTPSGTAMGIQTTFSDTANVAFILSNGDSTKYYILDFIRMRCTAAGASTTSSEVAVEVDNTNRISSGGSNLTLQNASTDSVAPSSNAQARIGVVTATAAGGRRRWLGQHLIKAGTAPCWVASTATVQGDVITFVFGAYSIVSPTVVAAYATTPVAVYQCLAFPPVVISPGGSFLLHIANVANATTAPSFDWEASWVEI